MIFKSNGYHSKLFSIRGFTLVEMSLALAIFALALASLTSFYVGGMQKFHSQSENTAREFALQRFLTQFEQDVMQHGNHDGLSELPQLDQSSLSLLHISSFTPGRETPQIKEVTYEYDSENELIKRNGRALSALHVTKFSVSLENILKSKSDSPKALILSLTYLDHKNGENHPRSLELHFNLEQFNQKQEFKHWASPLQLLTNSQQIQIAYSQ